MWYGVGGLTNKLSGVVREMVDEVEALELIGKGVGE